MMESASALKLMEISHYITCKEQIITLSKELMLVERRLFRALQPSDTRCVSVIGYSECILMRVIVCSAQFSLLDILSLKVMAVATNATNTC